MNSFILIVSIIGSLSGSLSLNAEFKIPEQTGAGPGDHGTHYFVPSTANIDSAFPDPIVVYTETLYGVGRSPMQPGECVCPRVNRPETVTMVPLGTTHVHAVTGEACSEGSEDCVRIGSTTDGRVCGNHVSDRDQQRCSVEWFVGKSGAMYMTYATTHPLNCFCAAHPEGKIMGAYYLGKVLIGGHGSVTMMAFNGTERPTLSMPVVCTGSRTRMTADGKFAVMDLNMDASGTVNGECYAAISTGDMIPYGRFSMSNEQRPQPSPQEPQRQNLTEVRLSIMAVAVIGLACCVMICSLVYMSRKLKFD